jgi:hypothetical protein
VEEGVEKQDSEKKTPFPKKRLSGNPQFFNLKKTLNTTCYIHIQHTHSINNNNKNFYKKESYYGLPVQHQ